MHVTNNPIASLRTPITKVDKGAFFNNVKVGMIFQDEDGSFVIEGIGNDGSPMGVIGHVVSSEYVIELEI